MRRKRPEEAFLDGYKPACLSWESMETFQKHKDQLLQYPHIYQFDDNPESYIFFQNEAMKKHFQEQTKGIKLNSYEYHVILGLTLGFPKRSVQYFAEMQKLKRHVYQERDEKYGVAVSWSGFFFKSNINFVESEIILMWSTYTHPKAIENIVFLRDDKLGSLKIEYGDLNRLKEIVESIKEIRGLKVNTYVT